MTLSEDVITFEPGEEGLAVRWGCLVENVRPVEEGREWERYTTVRDAERVYERAKTFWQRVKEAWLR